MTQTPPPEFVAWMARQALTLVPVAAAELLENAVELRIQNLALQRSNRDLAADRHGDPSLAHLIAGYQARIAELEQTIERMNHKRMRRPA